MRLLLAVASLDIILNYTKSLNRCFATMLSKWTNQFCLENGYHGHGRLLSNAIIKRLHIIRQVSVNWRMIQFSIRLALVVARHPLKYLPTDRIM